jgi:acetylornithine deacetylase/succinyl-diaminopimelate desuccinylase-like protein
MSRTNDEGKHRMTASTEDMNSDLRVVMQQQDLFLSRLIDYARQPSISTTGEGFPEATDRAVEEMRRAGLQPHVIATPGRPAVFGERSGPPGSPTVLIYGHYDVQPAGSLDLWRTPPFTPTVHADRLWGRGVADNKGQHFAHLQALRLLAERENSLPCTVKMFLDGEEEVGSPNLARTVEENRDLLAADLVIWSDGPVHESGRWCVLHGVRGMLGVRLHTRGANRVLHSGNFGNIAENAAAVLVSALASMRGPDGSVVIEGFDDDVEPLPEADAAAFAQMPLDLAAVLADIGVDRLDPAYGALGYFERMAAIPTLSINGISTGDLDRTIIPDEATARIDVRLVAGQDPDRVFAAIQAHMRRHAPSVTVTQDFAVPASRTPLDNPFTPVLAEAIAEVTGETPLLVPAYGGTLPDYVWTRLLGVASLGVPFANVDESNHGPNENLEIHRYLTGIALSMGILRALGTCEPLTAARRLSATRHPEER